jgi:hypothetical protein
MITILPDLPPNVVGLRATGNVTRQDFNAIVMPAIDALASQTDKINYLLLLETDISKFEPGAWMKDALLGLKHLFKWNRVAVVTNQKSVEKFTDIFSYVVPGNYRGFAIDELEAAKQWVAGRPQPSNGG